MENRDIRTCKKCGKTYVVYNDGDHFPGGKEKEDIYCPWCHHFEGTLITSGSVRVEKVEE